MSACALQVKDALKVLMGTTHASDSLYSLNLTLNPKS